MVTKKVRLGPLESRLLFTLEERDMRLFRFADVKSILKAGDSSARDVLFQLKRKHRISEIERGEYVLNPAKSGLKGQWAEDAYLVADHLAKDYYIGFWSALSYWGLTEQLPQTLFIATPKQKRDVRYGGQTFKFIRILSRRFFGFEERQTEGGKFKVASRERAILDALAYPQHCGGITEAPKALWQAKDDLDWSLLLDYLDRLGIDSVRRRLGYLLQTLDLEKSIQKKLKRQGKGFRWLDPSRSKAVKGYSREWGLILNVTEEELLAWRAS